MTVNPGTGFRSPLVRILYSPREHRLRAGWRLLIQSFLLVLFMLAFGCVALVAPRTFLSFILNPTSIWAVTAGELAQVVAVTLSVWLARRLLDHRPFADLGLRLSPHTVRDLGIGLLIALVMMGLIFSAELGLGWLTVTGASWNALPASDVVLSVSEFLAIFVLVGWGEELMSRGYHLQTIASGLNLASGLVISSAIFGVLHLGNPHASATAAAGILLAGLLLGYAYVRTGQLWMPIGLHIGWNFFEGVVFGFPVSGLDVYHLIFTRVSGPELWTGGAFGPEAGLVLIPATLIGAALVHVLGKRGARHEAAGQSHPIRSG